MTDATDSSCPRCKAFWIRSASVCRFCGFNPSSQGTEPSRFDPNGHGSPIGASDGTGTGGDRSKAKGVLAVLAAFVVAVGVVAAAVVLIPRAFDDDESADAGNHALSRVCAGQPVDESRAYDEANGSKGLLVLKPRADRWNSSADDASIQPSEVDLVACRTQSTKAHRTRSCALRADEGQGEMVRFTAEFYRVEVVIREARTGDIVYQETVGPRPDCPDLAFIDFEKKRYTIVPNDKADALIASFSAGSVPTDEASS